MVTVLEARNAWMPNRFAPLAFKILNASKICSVVIPYLESPGLSIISLLILNTPPGLNRQLMVSGIYPRVSSRNWI